MDGFAGQGCADGAGRLDAEFRWSTSNGGSGQSGRAGTGGGGGSAGSGLDVTPDAQGNGQQCADTLGGGGGGGGSGGCGGGSGIGGQGGGGSFAIMIAFDERGALTGLPQLEGNRIQRGVGGTVVRAALVASADWVERVRTVASLPMFSALNPAAEAVMEETAAMAAAAEAAVVVSL